MRFSRARALAMAALVCVLCLGVLVAASFALFSSSSQTNNHIQAGKLEVGFYRTGSSGVRLAEGGLLETYSEKFAESDYVDLGKDGSSVFNWSEAVPGMREQADLLVRNSGDVAFDYSITVVFGDAVNSAALLSQLRVTVTAGGKETAFLLSDSGAQNAVALGSLKAGASAEFSVELEFVAGTEIDNSAMGTSAQFDLTLSAVQQSPSA